MKRQTIIAAAPWVVPFATALLAGACSSSPARLYTLAPAQGEPAAFEAPRQVSINVDSVRIPERLNQPQIVIRQSNQELLAVENARWAAPLNDELRDALTTGVMERLHATDNHGLPQAHAATTYVIDVNIGQMDGTLNGPVVVDATWSLKFRDETQSCDISLADHSGKDLNDLVAAYQRMTQTLASGIAASVEGFGDGNAHARARDAPHCVSPLRRRGGS